MESSYLFKLVLTFEEPPTLDTLVVDYDIMCLHVPDIEVAFATFVMRLDFMLL